MRRRDELPHRLSQLPGSLLTREMLASPDLNLPDLTYLPRELYPRFPQTAQPGKKFLAGGLGSHALTSLVGMRRPSTFSPVTRGARDTNAILLSE